MTEPTKENLEESRQWRAQMVGLYYRGRLAKQQIKQLEAIPDWHWLTLTEKNKKELLKLAKKAPKPAHTTKLGQALIRYTTKSKAYDAEFNKKIRVLFPDWFIKSSDKKKEKLLALAKNGASKPDQTTRIGQALFKYTNHASKCYDKSFNDKIRSINPEWFVWGIMSIKQEELLILAASGTSKPVTRTQLGSALHRYTKSGQNQFNKAFNKRIRKLRPDWFENLTMTNKEKLLKLAKNGAPKPEYGTKLQTALTNYTHKKRRRTNDAFNKEIRALRPDWFNLKFKLTADKSKKELLELAKSGAPKPKSKTLIRNRLYWYTTPTYRTFDAVFNTKIRALRPDWFQAA